MRFKRREFVTLLGAATVAWPLAVHAQQPERMRRIGVLLAFSESDPEAQTWATAFQEGLQRLGWTQGRSIRIDYRWAGTDHDRLRTYAAELVGMAPDVIVAGPTPALAALHRETAHSRTDVTETERHSHFVPLAVVSRCSYMKPKLLDHLVGERKQCRRHGEVEQPRRLQIDDELELSESLASRLLLVFEDATGIDADLAIHVGEAGAVAHQPAGLDKFTH